MTVQDSISEKLVASASKVDDYILSLLEDRKPKVLYEASRFIFHAGGKRLRPYLVMKSCELVGGNPSQALPFAAGLEILHNFTLIHDDIMDNDPIRRGAPTIHAKWGVPVAIASGDLLFSKVYQAMYASYFDGSLPGDRVLESIKAVTDATIGICEGQVLDVSFPDTRDVSPAGLLRMGCGNSFPDRGRHPRRNGRRGDSGEARGERLERGEEDSDNRLRPRECFPRREESDPQCTRRRECGSPRYRGRQRGTSVHWRNRLR